MSRTFAVILVASLGFAAAGHAQSVGSDDIIKSLMPKGALGSSTRGLKPAKPAAAATGQAVQPASSAAPATVRPAPAAAAESSTADAAPSVNLTVQFANGSTQLTPAATRTLDELGRALSSQALANYRFRIEGHTDTVGRPDMNLALSQARAAAVVSYLSSKFNVATERLEAVGRGSQALLVPTPDQTAEPRNRRVQVVNLGA